MKNARKNGDWSVIHDSFDEINALIEKSKMLIEKNGLPKFYIKMLAELEDFVKLTASDKEGIKKMKKQTKHHFDRMKLKVRKHNENYAKEITHFRENPAEYAEEEREPVKSKSKVMP
jgi:translation initiation factor 3 subunit C